MSPFIIPNVIVYQKPVEITGEQAEQGSSAWLEYRRSHLNASEAGAVMGVNPWQPKSQYELCEVKSGERTLYRNAAMGWGHANEGIARTAVNSVLGEKFIPKVFSLKHNDLSYSASLDGINEKGDTILEIKCPYKGQESKLWKEVVAKKVPEHYLWQMHHQLFVSGAELCVFCVWTTDGKIMIDIERDETKIMELIEAWESFNDFFDWQYKERGEDHE